MTPLLSAVLACIPLLFLGIESHAKPRAATTPNVLLIMADDLGYGDLGCFGNDTIRTPHLDQLASQGVRLTHNLAAYGVCTPSRAAFLTGRYPVRSGMAPMGFLPAFTFTSSAGGLPVSEVTVAEVARRAGYRTALLGKWHQGWSVDREDPNHHHPLNQGFDYFYGVPLSNLPDFGDGSYKLHRRLYPNMVSGYLAALILVSATMVLVVWKGWVNKRCGVLLVLLFALGGGYYVFAFINLKLLNSMIYRNYDLVEQPIDMASMTRKLTAESDHFLRARHEDGLPFLLMVSWLHVHTTLVTAPQFKGQSRHGPYGDAVQEMDWGVGQLMEQLDRYGMTSDTWVYFTSDHGAEPMARDPHGNALGGSNGIFPGSKGENIPEGAIRVPTIIRWPGHITAGTIIDEPSSNMDVFPTIVDMLNASADTSTGHKKIDGKSMKSLLQKGNSAVAPHEFLFHYCDNTVHAVRYRPRTKKKAVWKLVLHEQDPTQPKHILTICKASLPLDPPRLYNLISDPTATEPLDPKKHKQIVTAMLQALREHESTIETMPSQFTFERMMWRAWQQPCCNFPLCQCSDRKFEGMFVDSH